MSTLFEIFHNIQQKIFPWLEGELDPLTEKEQQFIQVVSLMDRGKHMSQLQKSSKNGIASSRKRGIRNDPSTQSLRGRRSQPKQSQ